MTSDHVSARHHGLSVFFNRIPRDWSIAEYLSSSHPANLAPRKILDGWRKGLATIHDCDNRACCSDERRNRAADLIARFDEPGAGSDRNYGHLWLKGPNEAPSSSKKRKVAPPASTSTQDTLPPPNTINIFNTAGDHLSFNQASSSGPATFTHRVSRDDDVTPAPPVPTPAPLADENASPEPEVLSLDDSKSAFRKTYALMKDDLKWRLCSGRRVEDVVFNACCIMADEDFAVSPAQSFVLNVTTDETAKGWFEDDEWAEICESDLKLPDADPMFVDSMKRFLKLSSADELENILNSTNYCKPNTEYTPDARWNCRWADTVMRIMLNLFVAPGSPLRMPHLEDWYSSHLWATIIDQCLLSLPDMRVERKESTCRATGERKNRHRTKTGKHNRAKVGARLDGIIRSAADNSYEYGGVEVGRSFGGTSATKWLEDGWKLSKALRDMLYRLHELVEHDRTAIPALQVVGIVNAGLQLQCYRMSHPRGYTCILRKEPLETVPQGVDCIVKLLRLLVCVTQIKTMIYDSTRVVEHWQRDKSEEDLLREVVHGRKQVEPMLFWAHDSP